MEPLKKKFDKIYIDEASRDSRVAARALKLFEPRQISFVNGQPIARAKGSLSAEEFTQSKRQLYITPFKGQFFKRCPGNGASLACCNYFVLNLGVQCDMNCSYCYLQSFVNTPTLTVYSNIDDAFNELDAMSASLREKPLRIGTGETIDSLSLDELTLYSRELIGYFRNFPNWRLEFKTKSDKVDQFLDTEHGGNVIVSWSINPQEVIAREEHGTASLAARLQAASRCRERGFLTAFHIDPMIWHPDWEANYRSLAQTIHSQFSPKQVPYVSVGALRFQPEQRAVMRERFGLTSWVTSAEVFPGRDGKLRYDEHLRFQMFQTMQREFKRLDPDWNIFLCMENHEAWLATFDSSPRHVKGLEKIFEPIRVNGTEKKEALALC